MNSTVPQETAQTSGDGENLYLTPHALRLVRQVWQGRVVWQRRGRAGLPEFHVDDQRVGHEVDIELRWLHDHGYTEHAPLTTADEWVVERITEFGERVLAHWGADRNRFHDMTAAEARALVG